MRSGRTDVGLVNLALGLLPFRSYPSGGRVQDPGDPAGKAASEGMTSPASRTRPRVLVVDDEELIRLVLRDGLSRAGFDVDTAANGVEALDRFEPGRYSLVLTDLMMPTMGGWELSSRLRAVDATLPIIVLSAYGATLEDEAARRRVFLLHKPSPLDVIVKAIAKALARPPLPEAWILS